MSYLHILLCIKTSKGFKSGNIWMDKLFSQNEGSDCLSGFFRPSREFFTHMELPVKGFKIWPILETHGHWSVKVLSVPHLLWHGTSVYIFVSEDPWHSQLLPSVEHWSCHYLFYDLYLSRLGFENPTFRMRGHRFHRLRHHDQITYRKTQFEKLKLIQIHAITRFFFPYLAFLRISSVLKTSVPKFHCTDVFFVLIT